jgi:methyl-accepting chemotaxis protein
VVVKVAAACAVLALAACGGSSDSTSSASETYANGVCSDLSTWVTDVDGEIKTLTDAGLSINKGDLQDAVNQIADATDTMVTDIMELGPPETDAGTQVKSELDQLGTQLTEQADTIKQALDSSAPPLSKASTATAALSTMANDVSTTWDSVKNLDPGGELQDAFENGSDCKALQDQIDAIGS